MKTKPKIIKEVLQRDYLRPSKRISRVYILKDKQQAIKRSYSKEKSTSYQDERNLR